MLKNKIGKDKMIESLCAGFNFLKKRNTLIIAPVYFVLMILSITFYNIIQNVLFVTGFFEITIPKPIFYPIFLNSMFGIYFWLAILGLFIIMFSFSFIYYNISKTNSDKENKEKQRDGLKKCFFITLIGFLTFFIITFLGLLLLSYLNLITFILFVFLLIIAFLLVLLFYLTVIYSGLNKLTVKKAFNSAWYLLKNRFWLTVAFCILLYLVIFIILFIFSILVERIFFFDYTAAMIFGVLSVFLSVFYFVNSLSIFAKKFI